MENDPFSAEALVKDLDASGRRRLWLIKSLVSSGEIETALEMAAKLERFITKGDGLAKAEGAGSAPGAVALVQPNLHPSADSAAQRASPSNVAVTGAAAPPVPRRQRLLDAASRESFVREAAANDDNRHLARKFGLSVRQAHAIRISLSRFISEYRAAHR